jgi:hypothetical protein
VVEVVVAIEVHLVSGAIQFVALELLVSGCRLPRSSANKPQTIETPAPPK